jgi:hypothetical protein
VAAITLAINICAGRPSLEFVLILVAAASAELQTNSRASIAQSRRLITSGRALLDDSNRLLARRSSGSFAMHQALSPRTRKHRK